MQKVTLIFFFILFFLIGCSLTPNKKYNAEAANINAELSVAYLKLNKIELAKSKLLLALKQAPYDAKVREVLGYFFAYTGDLNLAEKNYLYAIKYSKEKSCVCCNYGIFLYQQNRYQEALNYFLLAANDINCLFVAKAYAFASVAASKLRQDNLAKQYRKRALLLDSRVFDNPLNLF